MDERAGKKVAQNLGWMANQITVHPEVGETKACGWLELIMKMSPAVRRKFLLLVRHSTLPLSISMNSMSGWKCVWHSRTGPLFHM